MTILNVMNLTKKFGSPTGATSDVAGGLIAVDNISFTLQEGEILGLLGPNGAGKTTTIQMLLGVLTPTAGQIIYFGKNIVSYREEILEKINFSSTYTNLPWDLTVTENLTFISYLYDIKDRNKRLNKIIQNFNLENLVDKKMSQLSAGQITRVNIAKAFINFPRVLLLDEPTASLDPEVAQYVRLFLLEERKNYKVSIILTSHNMSEVEEVCDRVIFINRGKIIADNTPYNLARSIEIAHVGLMVRDGLKRLLDFVEKNKIQFKTEGRYIVVDVREKDIGSFLQEITRKGVIYDEISINKPTLEDYFLQVVKLPI